MKPVHALQFVLFAIAVNALLLQIKIPVLGLIINAVLLPMALIVFTRLAKALPELGYSQGWSIFFLLITLAGFGCVAASNLGHDDQWSSTAKAGFAGLLSVGLFLVTMVIKTGTEKSTTLGGVVGLLALIGLCAFGYFGAAAPQMLLLVGVFALCLAVLALPALIGGMIGSGMADEDMRRQRESKPPKYHPFVDPNNPYSPFNKKK